MKATEKQKMGSKKENRLREFIRKLLDIDGVIELFSEYFEIGMPLTPRLKRAFDKWFDKKQAEKKDIK